MRRCVVLFLVLSSFCAQAQAPATPSQQPSAPSAEKKAEPATQNAPPQPVVPALPTAPTGDKAAAPDYSKEAVVIERLVTKVAFEKDGTGTREISLAARVLSQSGVQALAVLAFPYVSSNDTVEFDYMRVRKPDGTVIVTPDYNVLDMPAEVTRVAPMYSDLHEKHVTVKALGVGDVLEYVIRFRTIKPQVPGQFWFEYKFSKETVARDHQLQISVPRDKYVKVVSPDYKPEVREENDRRIYSWKTTNAEAKEAESRRETPPPDVQVTTFRSWDEVGRWYSELQAPQVVATPAIQAKAAELTKGLSTRDEKLRAIYDFVSTRFHYVSLSFGVGRYQPHAAQDVLDNEYGDCKDKHTLLASLLSAAGIEAWPVAINSSHKIDPDLPSPGQFDHVITYVPQGDKGLWLDTTPEVAPFGMLLATLRDKQALVMPRDKPAELKKTPADPPFATAQNLNVEGRLSKEGTFTGHVQQSYRGDAEVLFRYGFRNVPASHWKDLGQRIASSEGFGGEVDNVSASSPDDTRKPFEFSYDYTRKDYGGDWENHRIIAPFPAIGVESAAQQQKKPLDPVVLGAPGEVVYTAKVELPLPTTKLPSDLDLSEPWADFHSQYSAQGKTLNITRRLKVKQSEVPLDQWEKYKKFAKAVSDDWGEWIQLSSGGESESSKTAAHGLSPELEEKMEDARHALRRRDFSTAETIVREVLDKDPKAWGAHALLGAMYAIRGDTHAMLEQFQKEEELHPDNIDVHRGLTYYYLQQKQDDKASEQLHKWLASDPQNYDALLMLGGVLSRGKKFDEEVAMWEKASTLMPDRSDVRRALAMAYLQDKQVDKALPILDKELASETNAMVFNNVSYVLADTNTNLDKAKEWGDKALQLVEAESLQAGSGEAPLNSARLLGATWDTVGWINYRRGELDKAERYLRAGFDLSQDSLIGDHLGQVLEKQGKKKEAEHYYLLAISSIDGQDKTELREHYKALTGKAAPSNPLPDFTRGKPGAAATLTSPAEELSKARSYKIPSAHQQGSANFSVVFSPGKIDEVRFLSGDDNLRPMTDSILASSIRAEFPNEDPVRLTRRGLLYCGANGCELTLLLPADVHATE